MIEIKWLKNSVNRHRFCIKYVNFQIGCFTPYVISTFKIMDTNYIPCFYMVFNKTEGKNIQLGIRKTDQGDRAARIFLPSELRETE